MTTWILLPLACQTALLGGPTPLADENHTYRQVALESARWIRCAAIPSDRATA